MGDFIDHFKDIAEENLNAPVRNTQMIFGGTLISLVSVTKNKIYECEKNCWNANSCETKKRLMLNPKEKKLCVTEVLVDILNPTNYSCSIRRRYWRLIDCNAYTYSPSDICYKFSNNWIEDDENIEIAPRTKVRVAIRFPQFEKDAEVSSIMICNNGESAKMQIRPLNPDVLESILSSQSLVNKNSGKIAPAFDSDAQKFGYLFDRLEHECHSRTHNALTPKEIVKLENSINDTLFSIEQLLRSLPQEKAKIYKIKVSNLMQEYQQALISTKSEEKEKANLNARIDDLYNLTDREFEEWTADLFSALGFEVVLTPKTNDKGIDVICRRNGKLTVVQCKKYKGVVSSPDIQKFLGAIQNAEADEGYFVTTGTFSVGAEKAAKDTKIVLCDKIKIRELVEIALES